MSRILSKKVLENVASSGRITIHILTNRDAIRKDIG